MANIMVVYHSGFGHTEKQAQHVAKGAVAAGATVHLIKVEDLSEDLHELNDADAMIFGAPTYMGSLSAEFKKFMEASSKLWYKRAWKDKLAAGFTNSHSLSGDKLNSLVQLIVFAMQHGMLWVGQAEMNESPDGEPGKLDVVNRVGSWMGAMSQSESVPVDQSPTGGDLITAEKLGERVAKLASRFK